VAVALFAALANLAPGDKVIWDSPALSPYGNPQVPKKNTLLQGGARTPGMGGGPK
jgi:hypothetical protein